MNLLPFWKTILWKSWANRAVAISLASFAGFAAISATPTDMLAFVPDLVINGAKYVLATTGFVAGIASPFLRVIAQNFGTDPASGQQIVTAVGVAPAGTNPTPAVVVASPQSKS